MKLFFYSEPILTSILKFDKILVKWYSFVARQYTQQKYITKGKEIGHVDLLRNNEQRRVLLDEVGAELHEGFSDVSVLGDGQL